MSHGVSLDMGFSLSEFLPNQSLYSSAFSLSRTAGGRPEERREQSQAEFYADQNP